MKDIARAIFAGMKFDTVAQYEAQVKHASGLIAAAIDLNARAAALWRGELEKAEAELDLLHAYVGHEMLRSDYRTAGDMRAALEEMRQPIKCIPTESGYMCSHCGTTLRADSPDYQPPAPNPPPTQAVEPKYPCIRCGRLRTKAEGGTTFTVCDECWDVTGQQQRVQAVEPKEEA